MTTRERLRAAAEHKPCDRLPVSPFGFGMLDPEGPVARELVERCDPFLEVSSGCNVFGGRNCEEIRTQEGNCVRVRVPTPKGELTALIKQTDVTKHTVEFLCKDAADVEKYLSNDFEPDEVDGAGFVQEKRKRGQDALVLMGWPDAVCLPATLMSPYHFSLLWADAPDLMAQFVQEGARRLELHAEAACEAGVDAFRVVGGEYASTQLGPQAFERLVVEPDGRLVEIMHGGGALVYYHNHGPMMRYLDAIARIGVDYLDPMEMPPFGDADLGRAREIIDGRLCIVGTFDDMEDLGKLPLDRLKRMAEQRVRTYGTQGFCLGGSASGTYTAPAARAFCALADFVEQAGPPLR